MHTWKGDGDDLIILWRQSSSILWAPGMSELSMPSHAPVVFQDDRRQDSNYFVSSRNFLNTHTTFPPFLKHGENYFEDKVVCRSHNITIIIQHFRQQMVHFHVFPFTHSHIHFLFRAPLHQKPAWVFFAPCPLENLRQVKHVVLLSTIFIHVYQHGIFFFFSFSSHMKNTRKVDQRLSERTCNMVARETDQKIILTQLPYTYENRKWTNPKKNECSKHASFFQLMNKWR